MKIQTEDEALEAGRRARAEGKPRTSNPLKRYPAKSLFNAWLRGWDEDVRIPEVEVKVASVEIKTRSPAIYWPADKAFPSAYEVRRKPPVPCPNCRRLTLDTLSQAVVARSITQGIAYLWCRGCNFNFKMSVIEA